jgi:hypothetical protein
MLKFGFILASNGTIKARAQVTTRYAHPSIPKGLAKMEPE